ncbi:class I SAM-dependent DNA methyltransferase [Priestia megaterium]|uniref:HsdM family class I SAM-dependent methyltransferase n=1 Tax=Priestia megaterium TaxID=1404 RepID=UPI000E2FD016|nr:N-6 DNA methylase [Priestia megaterium]MED4051541.1 N-6 DNA methylase [Priestia megaterium]RFB41306.1 SAM-dependent DNA methyltransferase [Bacillus sp. RC]
MNLNEKEITQHVTQYLMTLGISTIKKDIEWKSYGRKKVDFVGYTINEEGKLTAEVVVEVHSKPTPEVQLRLTEASKALGVPYALLIVNDQKYWYDAKQFLPIIEGAPPSFCNALLYLKNEEEIRSTIEECFSRIVETAFITFEQSIQEVAAALLVRAYLEDEAGNELSNWDHLTGEKFMYWLKKATKHFGVLNTIHMHGIYYNVFSDIITLLRILPPSHPSLGKIFLAIIESNVRKENDNMYITPPIVRSLFHDIAQITADGLFAVNLGTGYGSLLHDVSTIRHWESLYGIEINPELCAVTQISVIISKLKNATITCNDALTSMRLDRGKYNFVFMDIPTGRVSGDRISEYEELFKVMEDNRRRKFDLAELFIERSIDICTPGGYILTTVPESLLFTSTTKSIRNFILDQCIVEAIISLPQHTFKPYTFTKSNLLLLRKKKQHGDAGKQIFMAKVDSLDDIPSIINSFIAAKQRGDLS